MESKITESKNKLYDDCFSKSLYKINFTFNFVYVILRKTIELIFMPYKVQNA